MLGASFRSELGLAMAKNGSDYSKTRRIWYAENMRYSTLVLMCVLVPVYSALAPEHNLAVFAMGEFVGLLFLGVAHILLRSKR